MIVRDNGWNVNENWLNETIVARKGNNSFKRSITLSKN